MYLFMKLDEFANKDGLSQMIIIITNKISFNRAFIIFSNFKLKKLKTHFPILQDFCSSP